MASNCSLHVPASKASGAPGSPLAPAAWALVAVGQHTGVMEENGPWWPGPPGSALPPGPPGRPRGNAELGASHPGPRPSPPKRGQRDTLTSCSCLSPRGCEAENGEATCQSHPKGKQQSQDLGIVWLSLCSQQHGLSRKPPLVFRLTCVQLGLRGTERGAADPLRSVLGFPRTHTRPPLRHYLLAAVKQPGSQETGPGGPTRHRPGPRGPWPELSEGDIEVLPGRGHAPTATPP